MPNMALKGQGFVSVSRIFNTIQNLVNLDQKVWAKRGGVEAPLLQASLE